MDPRQYPTLEVEKRGAADWVTLSRPDSLNAFNAAMVDDLADYFAARCVDSATRVIVLRGAGRSFCAGLDLKQMGERIAGMDMVERLAFQQRLSSIFLSMRRCPQPIVCLLHGAAAGGGFALAVASDIRYCTPDARMSAAAIKIGLSGCDVGLSYLLPRLVGASVATEMLMTGTFLDATRAHALGFVSTIVGVDELEAAGEAIVARLLDADSVGLALTKQGIDVGLSAPSLDVAVANEDRQQALLSGEEGFRARIRAFLGRSRG